MSGGYFDYKQWQISEFARELREAILNLGNSYSKKTVREFIKGYQIIEEAAIYGQRIDWLLSDDDGEDSFFERLAEELPEAQKETKSLIEYVENLPKKTSKKIEDYDEYYRLQEFRDYIIRQGKKIGYCGYNMRVSDGKKQCFVKQVFYSIKLKTFILINIKSSPVTKADREKMDFCLSVYEKKKSEIEREPVGIFITPGIHQFPHVEYVHKNISDEIFESDYLPALPEYYEFPDAVFKVHLNSYW